MTDSVIDMIDLRYDSDDSIISPIIAAATESRKDLMEITGDLSFHRNRETKYLLKQRKWYDMAQDEGESLSNKRRYINKAMKYEVKATHHRLEIEELEGEFDYKMNYELSPEEELLFAE